MIQHIADFLKVVPTVILGLLLGMVGVLVVCMGMVMWDFPLLTLKVIMGLTVMTVAATGLKRWAHSYNKER